MEQWLPLIAGGSSLIAGGSFAYFKLRHFFPVKVNCWFCNTDCKVPFRSKNSFVCPSCRQYNGFNEDGDYNCDMPSQYCEALNSPPTRTKLKQPSSSPSNPKLSLGNGLCQTCNLYQAMKVKALADFVPSHPDKFDEEVQVYERRLERLYGGLCPLCSKTLSCTLIEQDAWLKPKLLNWRIQQSSTLLKTLLSPVETGLSRPALCMTLLLRTLCVAMALSLLCLVLSGSKRDVLPLSTTSPANGSSERITANSSHSPPLLKGWGEWLVPKGGWWREVLLGHEAGAVVMLLVLQLAAVACAGKQHLKSCDAVACLSLVMALATVCWQQSDALVHLLTQSQLLAVKVGVYVIAVVSVAAGLRRPQPNRRQVNETSLLARHPRNSFLENSQISDGSLNASGDILGNSQCASPPRMVATQSAAVDAQNNTPSLPLSPTPIIARKSVPASTFLPACTSSAQNPFLITPSQQSGTDTSFVANKNPNPLQQKLSLKPSSLGEALNTSLEGLSLGTEKPAPNIGNSVSRSNIIGGRSDQNGMVLRSQQATFTQNTSNIAQASWVAGGYWGSPSKNKRLPVSQSSPLLNAPVIVSNGDAFPPSRPSSQSSGFVSYGSDSHSSADNAALNRNAFNANVENDRSSVASESAFRWNFEACETSSQGSQNTEYRSQASSNATVRRRVAASMAGYPGSDCHSLLTGTTAPSSLLSSASGAIMRDGDWRSQSPMQDVRSMRALSRLSQHDISDDNLSLISQRLVNSALCGANSPGSSLRNPWVAFFLGMSIMANLVLVVVLYKNGFLVETLR